MMAYLPECYALILGLALLLYGLLDGFDLGVGMLLPGLKSPAERQLALYSISPFWDGNETWMILAAGLLYAVFPKVYSQLLPLFYLPIFIMLAGLIFRGVAFEFCQKNQQHRRAWEHVFTLGSLLATLCQGWIIGSALSYGQSSRAYTLLFGFICAISLICANLLLGASWLLIKMPESSHQFLQKRLKRLIKLFSVCIVLLTVAAPWLNHAIASKWSANPVVPLVLTLLAFYNLSLAKRSLPAASHKTFLWLVSTISCCLLNLASSVWPYILPGYLTIRQAAADPQALRFLSIGVVLLLPMVLLYTGYAYYIFRGKVQLTDSY